MARGALLTLLIVVACVGRSDVDVPNGAGVADSEVVDLGGPSRDWNVDGLVLSKVHASQLVAMLEHNAKDVPDGLPEPLLAVDKRPAIVHELERGDDEAWSGLLTVANVYAVALRGHVVCLRDWAQVPCSTHGDTFAIDLLPWSAVQHTIVLDQIADAALFALLLLEDDRRAVDSTSMSHLIHEPEDWDDVTPPAGSAAPYEIDPPFPGCGFAVFHNGRHREHYETPHVLNRRPSASVLVAACQEYEPVWMVPVLIRNRVEVVGLDWVGRPVVLDGPVELPIPASITADPHTESLQFVWYVREGGVFLSSHTPEVGLR